MKTRTFRREMMEAYSIPIGIFVLFPIFVLGLIGGFDTLLLLGFGQLLIIVLVPCYLVGFLLAPWAGRSISKSKVPAFFKTALAASASVLTVTVVSSIGVETVFLPISIFLALFALPLSLVAAVLFIGRVEGLQENTRFYKVDLKQ